MVSLGVAKEHGVAKGIVDSADGKLPRDTVWPMEFWKGLIVGFRRLPLDTVWPREFWIVLMVSFRRLPRNTVWLRDLWEGLKVF